MSDKFRIKFSNGKIEGPFDQQQVRNLMDQGKLHTDDLFQTYPDGVWEKIENNFDDQDENTLFIKLGKIKDGEGLDVTEEDTQSFPQEFRHNDDQAKIKKSKNEDKTIVLGNDYSDKQDKTVLNKDTLKYLEQEKIRKLAEAANEPTEVPQEEKVDLKNDATQVVKLSDLKSAKKEAEDNDWDPKIEIEPENAEQDKTEFFKFDKETLEDHKKVNFKKLLITSFLIIFVLVVFFPDDGKQENDFKVRYPSFSFPIAKEYEEPEKAKSLLDQGLKELTDRDFLSLVKSSKYFKLSSEHKIDNNPALEYLFYTYARLLRESNNKKSDARTVYKLFKMFESRLVANPLLATASGYFFVNINKYEAAQYMIEKFLKVNNLLKRENEKSFFTPTNPTRELFSLYITVLTHLEKYEQAKSVLSAFESDKDWTKEMYIATVDYYLSIDDTVQAQKYVNEGLKKFTSSEDLLLLQCKMLIINQDYQNLGKVLKLVKKVESIFSPTNYSQFFHYLGILFFSEQKTDQAIALFKKSLDIRENEELTEQLAGVFNENMDQKIGLLARESKAKELIKNSDIENKNGDYDKAFSFLLDALEVAPELITPRLKLAQLQLERSLYTEAIDTMEDLFRKYPENKEVIFTLAKVYIESFRFSEAQKIISVVSNGPYKNDPEYFSLVASLYLKMNDFLQSASWLRKSYRSDPLNDDDIYKFSKLLLQYNKFDEAKKLIIKALELNPTNLNYHLVYAAIIYELEDVETALGYLRDLENDFPNNTKLLSEIAIYYYRSGQYKGFEYTKSKIEKIDKGGEDLYRFLLRKSIYNEEFKNVIKYGKKILEFKPHDLETRMLLGKILIEQENYQEALGILAFVKDRLEGYPKLQFYLSKLYLLTGNRERAKELAQKEVNENPSSDEGYVLLGDIYLEEQKYKQAETSYKKALDANPDSVDSLVGMAFINYKRNQHELALDLYKTAIDKRPNDASLHKKLGDVYRHIGQSKLAIESYKVHLDLNDNSPYKKQIQSYIRLLE